MSYLRLCQLAANYIHWWQFGDSLVMTGCWQVICGRQALIYSVFIMLLICLVLVPNRHERLFITVMTQYFHVRDSIFWYWWQAILMRWRCTLSLACECINLKKDNSGIGINSSLSSRFTNSVVGVDLTMYHFNYRIECGGRTDAWQYRPEDHGGLCTTMDLTIDTAMA